MIGITRQDKFHGHRLITAGLIPGIILLFLISEAPGKEFLTPSEIQKIQDAQEIDKRTRIYLDAATLRLRTTVDRLDGKESDPGDPLEFFSAEEMIEGYFLITRSVMMNLDEASQKASTERSRLSKALKDLKDNTEKASRELALLKKAAEERQKEELWNLINRAIDITDGAHEGAELALSHDTAPEKSKIRK